MSVADPKMLQAVTSFLERQRLEFSESDEQYSTKLTVRTGARVAYVNVYNTGKLVVAGPDSELKQLLNTMKQALEAGDSIPGQMLPFEIEKFPDTIRERVP